MPPGPPLAGAFWERHCADKLKKFGFIKVQDWESLYYHPILNLILTVYVDDFKMAGPRCNLQQGWDMIGKELVIDKPEEMGMYLGSNHVISQMSRKDLDQRLQTIVPLIFGERDSEESPVEAEPNLRSRKTRRTLRNRKVRRNIMPRSCKARVQALPKQSPLSQAYATTCATS